ncbi:TPA: hypothetical protein KR288_002710 [Clostridioides difficile]|uniref:hypothetical protein n=1 Tax=Clostridioides difficile TaxID=1496 RepID=UPI00093C0A29|nr:hypothetical protein [Clostridioides difficile]EGT3829010.1 hypothetical protein [Clostridioides difficile]EJX2691242.1 hypothetical protein [Clostridioides difficile]EJX3390123.1 hypothetical protein [Clostridioides difficile]MBG0232036.1 hypothetical protein [Clostridioides difficile]MBH7253699.1 hypothetical protein [Clostridioides difficile]
MKYISSLGIYITKLEDLRDKIDDDLYNWIEIHQDTEGYKDKFEELKEEFDYYTDIAKTNDICFLEISSLLESSIKILHQLENYIIETDRLNRKKILSFISSVNLKEIEETIDCK